MTEADVHVINPTAVYTLLSARSALGLTQTTLRREIRLRRLRVSKRAGRYFIVGEWLLAWLRAGEIHARQPAPVDGDSPNFSQ